MRRDNESRQMTRAPSASRTLGPRLIAAGALLLAATASQAPAATDAELFRCERVAAPLGEICHLGARTETPDGDAIPRPEASTPSEAPPAAEAPPIDDLLRRFLLHEITKAEREESRSPFVQNEQAPASFSRLIDEPSRANAAAFLAEQMELNLRHVKAQEAIRSVVLDLRAGQTGDDLLQGLADTSSEIRFHAITPRPPDAVLHELSMDRLRQRLEGAVTAQDRGPTQSMQPNPSTGRGLELRYYFSPSCPHCAEVTPAIETLERRYGTALTVVGIPIQLEGEALTPQALRAYRRRFDLSFPFEERPAEVARAVHEDDLHGVPHLVVLVHDVPGDPVHVPLPDARTTTDVERALLDILAATRGAHTPAPPSVHAAEWRSP